MAIYIYIKHKHINITHNKTHHKNQPHKQIIQTKAGANTPMQHTHTNKRITHTTHSDNNKQTNNNEHNKSTTWKHNINNEIKQHQPNSNNIKKIINMYLFTINNNM